MIRHRKRSIALAVALSALAGYVDARGFLGLDGYFVSFMSGNSTRLGIALGQGHIAQAGIIGGIIATFVTGVIAGSILGHYAHSFRPPAVLALVSLLLALSATCVHLGARPFGYGAMILAMGAENAIFQSGGEVSIGLTYMTGTLVKMGQRIAGSIIGDTSSRTWAPYAFQWLGMTMGALIGALLGEHGIWFAALYAAVFVPISLRIRQVLAAPRTPTEIP